MQKASLVNLRDGWDYCNLCKIAGSARHHVFGEGSHYGRFLFVGEGPGKVEDLRGKPFMGPSGRILRAALERVGLTEDDYFITNMVMCRPCDKPNGPNRRPTEEEINSCMPRLKSTIRSINPDRIIAVGAVAHTYLYTLRKEMKVYYTLRRVRHPAYYVRRGLHQPQGPLFELFVNDIEEAIKPGKVSNAKAEIQTRKRRNHARRTQ